MLLTTSLCAGCSRAFIRAVEEDDELPVPSPTYLLQNIYDEHAGKTFGSPAPNHLHSLTSAAQQASKLGACSCPLQTRCRYKSNGCDRLLWRYCLFLAALRTAGQQLLLGLSSLT